MGCEQCDMTFAAAAFSCHKEREGERQLGKQKYV
jgi:hypothetical protein